MFIAFSDLPPDARVWVYQLNRALGDVERQRVEDTMKEFCRGWSAHGSPLQTSYHLEYNHFLVLAVDEQSGDASGCSIDGSVRVLKEIGSVLHVDFFDRTSVGFLIDDRVKMYPVSSLKDLFGAGTLSASTITFDNLVATKAEFENGWRIPANRSWLAKYLPKSTLA